MKKYLYWIGSVIFLFIIFGTIYGVVQQSQRADANDPQIQIAEDTATELDQGITVTSLTQERIDMKNSLAPFTIIYNMSGTVVGGTGYLNNAVPTAPTGILTASDSGGYNAVTWQPATGVRIAAVTVRADRYYVLVGRSLTEVEKREDKTLELSAGGFALSLLVLGGMFIYLRKSKG